MDTKHTVPYRLSLLVTALMLVQSVLGLLFQGAYRDVEWIKATWFGNDWVTLVVAVPLMIAALIRARQGSTQAVLLWLGLLGYSIYNDAFYLFGVALNAFFPLYVVILVVSVAVLVLLLSGLDVANMAASFAPRTPVRLIGGYLTFVAATFFVLWFGMWAAYVFAGRPTPTPEPEAFKLVAALDLTLMMPALALGGVLLWRRRPMGLPHCRHRRHPGHTVPAGARGELGRRDRARPDRGARPAADLGHAGDLHCGGGGAVAHQCAVASHASARATEAWLGSLKRRPTQTPSGTCSRTVAPSSSGCTTCTCRDRLITHERAAASYDGARHVVYLYASPYEMGMGQEAYDGNASLCIANS